MMNALSLIQATVEPTVSAYAVDFITFDVMRGSSSWADSVFRKEKAKAADLGYKICSIFTKHGVRIPPMGDAPRKERDSNNWYILPGVQTIPAAVLPKIAADLEAHFKVHPGTTPFDRQSWMRKVRNGDEVCATVEPTGMPSVDDTLGLVSDWWSDDKLLTVKTRHFGTVHLGDVNDSSVMLDVVEGDHSGVTFFLDEQWGLRLEVESLNAKHVNKNVWNDERLQKAAQRGIAAFRTELGACLDRNASKIEAVVREARH